MFSKVIEGYTHRLIPCQPWNPEVDGPCNRLYVRYEAKLQYFESAWEPTEDELAMLNAGGPIILRLWGAQPVVEIGVAPPLFD